MHYSMFSAALDQIDVPRSEVWSIYQAFEQVSDGRHKRGKRYSVALILSLLLFRFHQLLGAKRQLLPNQH